MSAKPVRKPTPPEIETAVLANSARRCSLCFHLNGDLTEKLGQIAHLDDDRSNAVEDNLAWMCLAHHSLFDSRTSQHKNYTIPEVKAARTRLYGLVAQGNHLTPAAAQPYLQAEADKKILHDFIEMVPSTGPIRFLRQHHFGASFPIEQLDPIDSFIYNRNGPDHEFLDPELESARQQFRMKCQALLRLEVHLGPANVKGFVMVPKNNWDQRDHIIKELNDVADTVCSSYDDFVRLARKKLAV
jgi:hypothetical protein